MADHHARSLAQGPDQIDHVADEMEDRTGVTRLRPFGAAIAAHIGGDRMVAGIGQGLHLRPPADAEFGEAVNEQDQGAGPGLKNLLVQTVCLDVAGLHSGKGPFAGGSGKSLHPVRAANGEGDREAVEEGSIPVCAAGAPPSCFAWSPSPQSGGRRR